MMPIVKFEFKIEYPSGTTYVSFRCGDAQTSDNGRNDT